MITTSKFNSLDQLNEQIKQIDVRNIQLKKGKFFARFSEILSKDCILHNAFINTSILGEGTMSNNFYLFQLIKSSNKLIFRNSLSANNSIIVIAPGDEYKEVNFGEIIFLAVYVPKKKVEERLGILSTGIHNVIHENSIDEIWYLNSFLLNSTILNKVSIDYYFYLIIEKILTSFVSIINGNKNYKQLKNSFKFNHIIKFMKKERKNNLDISEISEYFNLTDRTLRNIFSNQFGISPKQYQISLQMNYLRDEIMKNEYSTISDIIINQGMSSQSYVTKEFSSYYNMTPNQFKRNFFSKIQSNDYLI